MINVLTVGNQHRVVVLALPLEHFKMIETGGSRLKMPFTHDCRLVPCFAKEFG